MNKTCITRIGLAAALAATLALGACGGDDDDDVVATPDAPATDGVPAGATSSTEGFASYLRRLVASANTDSLEPFDVNSLGTLPTSETEEPAAAE